MTLPLNRTGGTTFPTSPSAGDWHYDENTGEAFVYDGTRGLWLGVSVYTFDLAQLGDLAATDALKLLGAPTSVDYGHSLPFAATVVGASVRTKVAQAQANIGFYAGAQFLGNLAWSSTDSYAAADDLAWYVAPDTPLSAFTQHDLDGGVTASLYLRRNGGNDQ